MGLVLRSAWWAGVLGLLLVVPSGLASHLNNYYTNPVERDDQGRSDEPDFATTHVLGPHVENRIYDPTPFDPEGSIPDRLLPPTPPGRSPRLAPGCSDDGGRQPSGLCGVRTVGIGGLPWPQELSCAWGCFYPGPDAPGRFSETRHTRFRFLDAVAPLQATLPVGGAQYLELNRKVDDSGLRQMLSGAGVAVGTVLPGSAGLWAWHGMWRDLNANGVIDDVGSANANEDPPGAFPEDEFTWVGNCFRFPSGPGVERADICHKEPTSLLGWVFPGDHHDARGSLVPAASVVAPADLPARQVVCAADIYASHKSLAYSEGLAAADLPLACARSYGELEGSTAGGDPLLGAPDGLDPDLVYQDRTGDPSRTLRMWIAGGGGAFAFYDESIATTTVMVTGAFSPPCTLPCAPMALADARLVDVDLYPSLHPVLDQLLGGMVKPAVRAPWLVVRSSLGAVERTDEALAFHAALNRDPVLGAVDDALLQRGVPHEPDTVLDQTPAVFGTGPDPLARQHGWYNDYAAYLEGPRPWLDVREVRVAFAQVALTVTAGGQPVGLSCVLCVAGPTTPMPPVLDGGTPGSARPLRPGAYVFEANLGTWRDQVQHFVEEVVDPSCVVDPKDCDGPESLVRSLRYSVGPDAWIGSIVNTTGYWKYRGFTTDSCTILGEAAERAYAVCHPTRDGVLEDGNDYAGGAQVEEFRGACVTGSFPGAPLTPAAGAPVIHVVPLDADGQPGVWEAPAFVDRRYHQKNIDLLPSPGAGQLEDWTGQGPITLQARCSAGVATTSGFLRSEDLLLLPAGNTGQKVLVRMEAAPMVAGLHERIVDVDVYDAMLP